MDLLLKKQLDAHLQVLNQTLSESAPLLEEIAEVLCRCFDSHHKLLLCGNGGSAADAQHIAAEFINRFRMDRAALPAIALTTDSSVLTSVGNDSEYDSIFSRQVEALAVKGDTVVGISTSGHSANVLKALEAARLRGATLIGFTGEGGREGMAPQCDYCLIVPSVDTARIQEVHEFAWHVICGMVENRLFGDRM